MDKDIRIITEGVTGCVLLKENKAIKHTYARDLYWMNEVAILQYMKPHHTENIIKLESVEIGPMYGECKATLHKKELDDKYVKTIFPRYQPVKMRSLHNTNELIQFLLDVTSGLSFMHKHNILHRDLKIQNILYDGKKYIIIDFSHSYKINKCNSNFRNRVTTITHEPPEIFFARAKQKSELVYTTAIDTWSLGIMLLDIISNGKAGSSLYQSSSSSTKTMSEFMESKASVSQFITNHTCLLDPKYNVFIKWVRVLLNVKPKRRITAHAMYKTIKNYAEKNNIAHRVPFNVDNEDYKIVLPEKLDKEFAGGLTMGADYIYDIVEKIDLHITTPIFITRMYKDALLDVIDTIILDKVLDYNEKGDVKLRHMYNIIIHNACNLYASFLPKNVKLKYKFAQCITF
jgi:serine/threonine protein kinase